MHYIASLRTAYVHRSGSGERLTPGRSVTESVVAFDGVELFSRAHDKCVVRGIRQQAMCLPAARLPVTEALIDSL
jgi:hypothetical protein